METAAEVLDSRALLEFCDMDSDNQVPDGNTLGRLRNLLINNGVQEKLFAQVVRLLMACELILKKGTIIPKNTIPRSAKADGKTEYDVCAGKLDFG